MDPHYRLSIFSPIDCISQSATKRSHVFDKVAVSEIGRKSLFMSLGALFLGTWITSAFFHTSGTDACWREALKIEVTGRANTCAYDFRTQFGISSGPTAFEDDIADNLEYVHFFFLDNKFNREIAVGAFRLIIRRGNMSKRGEVTGNGYEGIVDFISELLTRNNLVFYN